MLTQKSANFDNSPPQKKVKSMGKFIHNFFVGWGKIDFLAEYSPITLSPLRSLANITRIYAKDQIYGGFSQGA